MMYQLFIHFVLFTLDIYDLHPWCTGLLFGTRDYNKRTCLIATQYINAF